MTVRVRVLVGALLATGIALAVACGGDDSAARPAAEAADAEHRGDEKPQRQERPLPAFSGFTLDDQRLDIKDHIGRRLVVYFFDPAAKSSADVTRAVVRVAEFGAKHNFEIVGVAVGSSRPKARAFAEAHGVGFPVLDDASRRIARRFGLEAEAALLGVDAEGYLVWATLQFPPPGTPDLVDVIEAEIRSSLRLPDAAEEGPGELPDAPTFTASTLEGNQPFDFASTSGRPRILIFFLHTCPHCHEALEVLETTLAGLPEEKRPPLYGIELTGRRADVRRRLQEDGLDFFPVLFDDSGKAIQAYGVFGGVPDMMLIDAADRIVHRIRGWRETDGPLLRMRLAKLVGAPVPMLLRAEGYSGNEVCGVCHTSQHQTWQLTKHARAYDTLVKHGSDADPECVGCHVVGHGETGGFSITTRSAELEDVGCESCHGRGGPHLSPGFAPGGDYREACGTCHNPQHSLGFEYATFLPRISHAANAHILALPGDERRRILEQRGALRTDLLPTQAEYVGSESCRSCHPREFGKWAEGPHARAFATLEAEGKAGDDDCRKCHTTGFGRVGGFPPAGAAAEHSDLARVGCESCHGPGGDHIAESATKLGSIVSLGDKCDSCVILQICGSCHDDANDPGFEFEVQEKIDAIRHATIEAGTGKPLEPSAGAAGISESALIARAFEARRRLAEGAWTRN